MSHAPTPDDESFQDRILQGVSRTFALTIPTLPAELYRAVANAYLLCRIADTIEDDAGLEFDDKQRYSQAFIDVIRGEADGAAFGHELAPYQGQETVNGLPDQPAMDRYCYYVAGVVGEMLTELFCDHCPGLKAHKPEMLRLAVSFGQGLQMTNILKDIWDDRERGACWLPADVFTPRGIRLGEIEPGGGGADFEDGLGQLIAIAHGHLRNALRYTAMIPRGETGIRKFCLWALGMAVLTLRKIDQHRDFADGQEVKISRRSVKATVISTNLLVRSNLALQLLFSAASRGLPQREITASVPDIIDKAHSRVV